MPNVAVNSISGSQNVREPGKSKDIFEFSK
jgi:hypothetical protein